MNHVSISIVAAVCSLLSGGCSDRPTVVKPPGVVSTAQNLTARDFAEKRLNSETEAVSRFREVRASIGFNSQPDERVSVRRETARDCLALVKDALRPAEMKSCIRAGELSALDTDESCWVVQVDHGIEGGQAAYFDDMGHLLFAWFVPEG